MPTLLCDEEAAKQKTNALVGFARTRARIRTHARTHARMQWKGAYDWSLSAGLEGGWSGLCIEPEFAVVEAIRRRRHCGAVGVHVPRETTLQKVRGPLIGMAYIVMTLCSYGPM